MKNNILKSQSGASAVEFAIILPLLLLLVFGIIEFGVMFYDKAMITNAAREGARKGILQQDPRVAVLDINKAICNSLMNASDTDCNGVVPDKLISFANTKPNVTIVTINSTDTTFNICNAFEDNLKVTVTYPYSYLYLPFGSTTLKGEAVMKCE